MEQLRELRELRALRVNLHGTVKSSDPCDQKGCGKDRGETVDSRQVSEDIRPLG